MKSPLAPLNPNPAPHPRQSGKRRDESPAARVRPPDFIHHFSSLIRACSFPVLLFAVSACLALTGCGFLKPAKATTRQFILTPLSAGGSAPTAASSLALGVGQVKLPAYLFDKSLAIRRSTNEIVYETSILWAERLDNGMQRVLAANLATLLPTDQIRLSAWRSEDVSAEVYVAVEQFDVDASGRGVLVAWWRVLSPGGEKTLKAGECRLSKQGPAPATDPHGAVATMSDLLADLSRQITAAIKESAAR